MASETAHFVRSCPRIWFVPSTSRDVRRGGLVRLEMKLPRRCHGAIRGVVRLVASPTWPPGPPGPGSDQGIAIGRFREQVPLPAG